MGSLVQVGGVLTTDRVLPAAEKFRARKSVKRDSGVFGGSIPEEGSGVFDLYVALDALES
jgi:hypothetical protein